ncbi:MAG TPA: hypothetical protein VF791_24660 [Pyrinomonadaceae bacterium]
MPHQARIEDAQRIVDNRLAQRVFNAPASYHPCSRRYTSGYLLTRRLRG